MTDADREAIEGQIGPANVPQQARREVIYSIAFRAGMKLAAEICDSEARRPDESEIGSTTAKLLARLIRNAAEK